MTLRCRAVTAALLGAILAPATGFGQNASERLYRAYYLEHQQQNYEAAAKLYQEVIAERGADAELRGVAQTRLAACREELQAVDFAALMPPEPIAYVELNRPGEQLVALLEKLGLALDRDQLVKLSGNRVAISPELVREVLGIRGAAVALTGFDPQRERPSGIAVLHPGRVEIIRGLIESALPAAATVVPPIGGYPTFQIEDEVFVTLTRKLIIASDTRDEIEDAIARLQGKDDESLARNAAYAETLRDRDSALLFFCVHAKPLAPLIQAGLAAAGSESREAQIAHALLDPASLHAVSGRVGVNAEGLFLDVSLRLAEGHRNLVYNLLRTPAIPEATLRAIPPGVAGFVIGALNEAPSRFGGAPAERDAAAAPPIVTLLDLGREVFGNIVGYAAYVLPPEAERAKSGGVPLPDAALVFTVRDPGRTQAMWSQMLGIASLAAGTGALEGAAEDVGGVSVRRYTFPERISVYTATTGNEFYVALTRGAVERSLAARRANQSVRNDETMQRSMQRISATSTIAAVVHAGRCAQLARLYIPARELDEAEPFLNALSDTAGALVVDHSDTLFRVSAVVTGIPRVGDLVAQKLIEERGRGETRSRARQIVAARRSDDALAERDRRPADADETDDERLTRVQAALGAGRIDAAAALVDELAQRHADDAMELNNLAWALLTEPRFAGRLNRVALRWATRACEQAPENWMIVDTLARAKFENGDVRGAVELQERALDLCKGTRAREVRAALDRYRGALAAADASP
ncbi:MAG: hypothetical protein AB7Q17_15800 [Phycisphaerae bacterium]